MAKTALEIASANAVESREVATLKRRDEFPFTAGVVDEWRALGVPVKVRHATEGAAAVGRKGEAGAHYSGSGWELTTVKKRRRIGIAFGPDYFPE